MLTMVYQEQHAFFLYVVYSQVPPIFKGDSC
jgi:hypothetical protein